MADAVPPHEAAFQAQTKFMIDSIDAGSVSPACLAEGLISEPQREDCFREPNTYKKAELLLGYVKKSIIGDDRTNFDKFVAILRRTGHSRHADKLTQNLTSKQSSKGATAGAQPGTSQVSAFAGSCDMVTVDSVSQSGSIMASSADLEWNHVSDVQLGTDDLGDLCTALTPITSRWESFAIRLGIPHATIKTIKKKNNHDPTDCLNDALTEWLDGNYNIVRHGHQSWRKVCKETANKAGGNNNAQAKKIAAEHPVQQHGAGQKQLVTAPDQLPSAGREETDSDAISKQSRRIETEDGGGCVMQSQVVKGPGVSGHASGNARHPSGNASESHIASFHTKITTNPQAKGIVVIVTNGNKYQGPVYEKLDFTKQDGEEITKAFEALKFPCCHFEELTGEEIKVLIQGMEAYEYPKSYQYVGFVYSGHGDKEGNKSVLVGVDGSLVDTCEGVVKPLKKIDLPICKLIFLDACRGDVDPPTPPKKKGRPKANSCLVAYATRFGETAYEHDTCKGSQWLFRLAKKLNEEKSLQQILREVKKEILKAEYVQYPEVDLTDCPYPIELWKDTPVQAKGAEVSVVRVDEKPNIGDLASFPRVGGMGMIRIIDSVSDWKTLARQLLKNDEKRRVLLNNTGNKTECTLAVLNQWLSEPNPKVHHTWELLLDCLSDAGVEESVLQDIEAHIDWKPKFPMELIDVTQKECEPSKPTEDQHQAVKEFAATEVQVVIQSCSNVEYFAALEAIERPPLLMFDKPVRYPIDKFTIVVGTFAGKNAAIVRTKQGTKCRDDLTTVLSFFPNATMLLGLGVCMGIKHNLGDVLVGEKIQLEVNPKVRRGKLQLVGTCKEAKQTVGNVFCDTTGWSHFECATVPEGSGAKPRISKAFSGCILSSQYLLGDPNITHGLESETQLIGAEMEGWVLFKDIEESFPKIESLIIKGICDYGDGTKNDDWQLTAAKAAVDYARFKLDKNAF